MKQLYRLYLIGYVPPGWENKEISEAEMQHMMEPCDLCFTVDGNAGWPLGDVITPDKHISGTGAELRGFEFVLGIPYRCVAHEYDGKVVLVTAVKGIH